MSDGSPNKSRVPLRVLHGLAGAAGQPAILAAALRRHGVDAQAVSIGKAKFQYPADITYSPGPDRVQTGCDMVEDLLDQFDVFHLHARSFLYTDPTNLQFPHAWDLLLLRLAGKKVVFHFRGSEIRLHSEFRARSPYHYVDEDPDNLVSRFPESAMRMNCEVVRSLAHRVFVTDPELQGYVPGSKIVNRAVDLGSLQHVGTGIQSTPLIVHAPSRRLVKGTASLLAAIDKLRAQGLQFRFKLVEGLKHEEAVRIYQQADIVVDQLRIGWYGVLATECMAMGKATVSYIREDLQPHLGDRPPLACADPTNIAEVLAPLINDAICRAELGQTARAYCERHHCSKKIATQLLDEYNSIDLRETTTALKPLLDLIRHQTIQSRRPGSRIVQSSPSIPSRLRSSIRHRGLLGTARAILQVAGHRLGR